MSDGEEPVAKMSKIEGAQVEGGEGVEELDEGQEEWLSEGILTDDDCNQTAEQEKSDSNAVTSQDDTASQDSSMEQDAPQEAGPAPHQPPETKENIEQTLNNLENSKEDQEEFPEELGAFLIRKNDGRVVETTETPKDNDSDLDESTKQSEDDGHDTDELLRMLGEDNSKKKKDNSSLQGMKVKGMQQSSEEEDDEYIFEGAKVTRLRVAKNVLMNSEMTMKRLKVAKGAAGPRRAARALPEDADVDVSTKVKLKGIKSRPTRVPSKATSEDLSDLDAESDMSGDEAMTVERMFGVGGGGAGGGSGGARGRRGGINALRTVTQRVVSIHTRGRGGTAATSTPKPPQRVAFKSTSTRTHGPQPQGSGDTHRQDRERHHEDAETEEGAEEVEEVEEGEESDWEGEGGEGEGEGGGERQRLVRPERMDEEVPSDADSRSDNDSFYDELPSSDSDDFDDWFTLDVRAERAGDYIPLLGPTGYQLLAEERARVGGRLGTLRQSAGALAASRRAQRQQLRLAHAQLAQLDAALRAS